MRLARLFLLAVIAAAGLCAVPSAAAEAPDGREREARALFDSAVERLRDGQFAEARDLLNQSLGLAPHAATAFNLGVAYRGTGESLRARDTLKQLLAGAYGPLEPARRAEVTDLLAAVQAEIGVVQVEASGAPSIQIRVDGRHVGDVSDGARFTWQTDAGERVVTASAADRIPIERRVRVERGRRVRVSFALEPTPEARVGHVVVVATDARDTVEIVGVARARGRLERDVPPGRYTVRLVAEDGTREALIAVRPRSTVRYQFDAARDRSLWQSPVFWASAAGVVAATAVSVVLLSAPRREDPVRDREFGVVQALRVGP